MQRTWAIAVIGLAIVIFAVFSTVALADETTDPAAPDGFVTVDGGVIGEPWEDVDDSR
jgi:hypothetical protein